MTTDGARAPDRVLVAGDWHGNHHWARRVIERLPGLLPDESPRLVLHAGDFGVWPSRAGASYLEAVEGALADAGAELWFVDGNHEWFPRLEAAPTADRPAAVTAGDTGRITPRIRHLRRGTRWRWHGRAWLALGGAASVDRAVRTEGSSWWPQEEITAAQADAVVAAGRADVMLTHDCPSGVAHEFGDAPALWDAADLDRAHAHRELVQRVVDGVRPRHLLHGHLHRAYTREVAMAHGPVDVVGLDCDGTGPDNWTILDVRTLRLPPGWPPPA